MRKITWGIEAFEPGIFTGFGSSWRAGLAISSLLQESLARSLITFHLSSLLWARVSDFAKVFKKK